MKGFEVPDDEGFELALSAFVPDAAGARANAEARGFMFCRGARVVALRCLEADRAAADYAWAGLREGDEELARRNAEAKRAERQWKRIEEALQRAVEGVAKTDTEAAKLARGALVDFMNAWYAEDPADALRRAFDEADAAARAYFVEIRGSGAGPGSTAAMLKRIDANTAIAAGRAKAASKRGVEYRNAQLEADKEERDRKRRDREKWIAAGRRLMKKGQSARSAAKNIHAREGCPYSESYLADLFSCRKKRRR